MTATAPELLDSKRSVLGRAFDILECFSGGQTEQSITALCTRTGLPPATVHRMLANLVEWGAVERAARGRYRLGRRLWRLGNDVPSSRALKDIARPCLVDLHTMTGEVALLATRDDDHMMVADVIAGRTQLNGWTAPRQLTLQSAPGLVALAHAPWEESRQYVLGDGAESSPARREFRARQLFGEIRRSGVAVATQGGRTWVSSAVFDENGQIRSTISALAEPERANVPALSRVVRGAAQAVTAGLRDQASSVG